MSRKISFNIGSASVQGLLWDTVQQPKAIVQLVHGMAEHIGRYEEFARFLNNRGIIACGHDHPGHGMNIESGEPGDFGSEGWTGLVKATGLVHDELRHLYPGKPAFLLGHSMGSIVVRCLIHIKKPELAGVILSGSGSSSKADLTLGRIMTGLDSVLSGSKNPGRITAAMLNRQYSVRFPGEGPYGWLSTDPAQVERYEKDPLCGYAFPAASYQELFSGIQWAEKSEQSAKPMDCPVLIVSGALDPVGHQGKDPQKIFEKYKTIAGKGSFLKIYPNMRHEILNEIQRLQVYEDIAQWIENTMKQR